MSYIQIFVMAFGALVAVVGLALMYFPKEKGRSIIRISGYEFNLATPSLVVVVIGCGGPTRSSSSESESKAATEPNAATERRAMAKPRPATEAEAASERPPQLQQLSQKLSSKSRSFAS